jgi:hypothetical protein
MTYTPQNFAVWTTSRELRRSRTAHLMMTWVVICLCLGVWAAPVAGQQATVPHLKAAFLSNFAKFTEWPADALSAGERLSLCVLGDASVADALERTINGRHVESHELVVQIVNMDGPLRSCHILYATGLDTARSTQLLKSLIGVAVFTVSDSDQFAEFGGTAQLILDGNRMRFAINVGSAQRARLTLSSKLLGLAKIVKDGPNVPR